MHILYTIYQKLRVTDIMHILQCNIQPKALKLKLGVSPYLYGKQVMADRNTLYVTYLLTYILTYPACIYLSMYLLGKKVAPLTKPLKKKEKKKV